MFYIVYMEYQLIGKKNEYDMGLSRNVWFFSSFVAIWLGKLMINQYIAWLLWHQRTVWWGHRFLANSAEAGGKLNVSCILLMYCFSCVACGVLFFPFDDLFLRVENGKSFG